MTGLDLGALVGRVVLDTTSFDRAYTRTVGRMSAFGREANKAAAGTDKLDASLDGTAASANRAVDSLSRSSKAMIDNAAAADKATTSTKRSSDTTTQAAAADDKAAAASRVRSEALMRVNAVLASVREESTRVQQATLRDLATQERLGATYTETGSQAARLAAETARVASAQAAAIGSADRLAAAERASGAAAAAAGAESATMAGRFRTGVAGMARTAGELGLLVGGIELFKKALDITHEATVFQASITRIQTQAGASASELNGFSSALLKLSPQVAQSPDDLATSLYHVYSATKALGYTGPQMLKAVDVAAKGATVSGADLEQTTNALTATMVSGLGSVNNMGKAMGALNAIVGAGDMKLEDLNSALGTGILAVAKVFGVTLSQAGAALAVFGDNNIRGAKAATTLRMVIQDLTKPAATASETLGKIGLSVTSLRDDLQKGGLSLALTDLKAKLNAAGVTGDRVGGFIEDAFTKKAGVGLAMLLNNLDQYDEKQKQIATGANNFGAEWQATTKTARFALDSLWKSIEAGGIVLAGKLTPAVAAAANWLGTSLPHAIGVLADILGPTVHLIGDGLVGAWHALVAVLGPIVGLLGSVGHYLADNKKLATGLAVAVITMWAAFKGIAIATTAVEAVKGALLSLRASMMLARASGQSAFSGIAAAISPMSIAIVGIGTLVGGLAMEWEKHQETVQAAIAAENADIQSLTDTIQQDSGAIGQNTKAWIENKLTQAGAYDQASKLGVSFDTITKAAMGQKSALKQVHAAFDALGTGERFNVFREGAGTIFELGDATQKAADKVRTLNELNAAGVVKIGLLDRAAAEAKNTVQSSVQTFQDAGAAAKGMGTAMYGAWLSGKKLAAAMQELSGRVSTAQAFIAMKQGVLGLKEAFDKNTSSIDVNTKAGSDNRAALVAQIGNIQSYAATLDHGKDAAQNVTNAWLNGLSALKQQAMQLGVSKSAWARLIQTMRLTPHDIRTVAHAETNAAMENVRTLRNELANLPRQVGISVNATGSINVKGGGHYAGGGTIHGPGTSKSDSVPIMASRGEEVIQEPYASQYRSILKAMNVGRYASGGTITTKKVGGKTVWMVGNHQYDSRTAAQNAINSQTASTGETRASGALTGIGLDSSSFRWAKFQKQIASATQAIKDALAAGISHSQYVSLQQRLARDQKRGEQIEHKLGVSAGQQATKLGRSVDNLRKVASPSDITGSIHSLEHTLQQAGLPKDFIRGLASENQQIAGLVASRNRAAAALVKANAAMAKARSAELQDFRSFRSATVGGFDITSAGQNANGVVTSGSLFAAQTQDLARTKAWVSGIDKLAAMKIFPAAYLRQLVGAGPSSLGTVRALLAMRHGRLEQFAAQERQIFNLGSDVGQHVVARLDTRRLQQADKAVQRAQARQDKAQDKLRAEVRDLGDRIVNELKDHRRVVADFGPGSLRKLQIILDSSNTHHNRIMRGGGKG